jgi:nitrate reductase gamma subunit
MVTWFLTGPFLYLAATVLLAGSAYKIARMARMPRHLRWELYPLPRLGLNGSKYQKLDYSALPRHADHLAEAAYMAEEILFFKKVFRHRRSLWPASYLLHVGLYLSIASLGLVALEAILLVLGLPADSGLLVFLHAPAVAAGGCGLAAGLAGAIWLLCLRWRDENLRAVSDTVSFLNLAFLLAVFAAGWVAWLVADPVFLQTRAHAALLLRGRPEAVQSPLLALAMVLAGLFAMYLPFSRMFHFAAKYFFYHWILWDEEPMRAGSPMERDIAGCLEYRTTWSARHVRPEATWLEQATGCQTEKGAQNG